MYRTTNVLAVTADDIFDRVQRPPPSRIHPPNWGCTNKRICCLLCSLSTRVRERGGWMASKSKKSSALQRARESVYKKWLRRSWRLAPDPVPVRTIAATAVPPKRSIDRARRRHARLVEKCSRADPRLV